MSLQVSSNDALVWLLAKEEERAVYISAAVAVI